MMKSKIFFMLLFFTWQEVKGSKSRGEGRLLSWIKKCSVLLAVNEVCNFRRNRVPACKYTIPNQNAALMMEYIVCSKDPDFEKYLVDNSENCSNVMKLYEETKSFGACALDKIPLYLKQQNIAKAALAKFRGKQVSRKTSTKMLQEYMATTEFDEETKKQLLEYAVNKVNGKSFDYFQFENMLELTRMMTKSYSWMGRPLDETHKDFNTGHATRFYELAKDIDSDHVALTLKFANPMEEFSYRQVQEILKSHSPMKDVSVEEVKRVFELVKLTSEYSNRLAVKEALNPKYKDINVPHAKKMITLTKIMYPGNKIDLAVEEAMKPEYKGVNVEKVQEKFSEYLRLMFEPNDAAKKALMEKALRKALKKTHPEIVKQDF